MRQHFSIMYISKKDREIIRLKYGGKCAYSGTDLESDWQVDHIKPVVRNWWTNTAIFEDAHNIDNMVPVQKIINHYKHSYSLEELRTWLLGGLHNRLKKLPKQPKTEKSKRHKDYMLKLASYFNITPDKPFSGKFYFEAISEATPDLSEAINIQDEEPF